MFALKERPCIARPLKSFRIAEDEAADAGERKFVAFPFIAPRGDVSKRYISFDVDGAHIVERVPNVFCGPVKNRSFFWVDFVDVHADSVFACEHNNLSILVISGVSDFGFLPLTRDARLREF